MQGREVRKEAAQGMRRQKDGVLPDNDSSCHLVLGYIGKHSYMLSSSGMIQC